MKVLRARDLRAELARGEIDIANTNGITTRLHRTDQPRIGRLEQAGLV